MRSPTVTENRAAPGPDGYQPWMWGDLPRRALVSAAPVRLPAPEAKPGGARVAWAPRGAGVIAASCPFQAWSLAEAIRIDPLLEV